MIGSIQSIFSTIMAIQGILFFIQVHSVLMACKLSKHDPSTLNDELKPIANVIPEECPQFPEYVFSLSDYLLQSNPSASRELVRQSSQGLKSIRSLFDLFLYSAFILTYIENVLFYFMLVYIPYRIVAKGIELAFKAAFYGGLALFLVTMFADKWSAKIDEVIDEQTQELIQREGEKVAISMLGLSKHIILSVGGNLNLLRVAVEQSPSF